jgi:hypothetical protein
MSRKILAAVTPDAAKNRVKADGGLVINITDWLWKS